jgi:hypothetical protein
VSSPIPGERWIDRLEGWIPYLIGWDCWKAVLTWCPVGALLGVLIGVWPGRPDVLDSVAVGAGGALYLIVVIGMLLGVVYVVLLLWIGAYALVRFLMVRRPSR